MTLKARVSFASRLGLPLRQAKILARLDTPQKIQAYLDRMAMNHEPKGDTCLPIIKSLAAKKAHCIEAAFIAACALWIHGKKPLLMDFQAQGDDDHVVALFKEGECWGAISKSNHVWLRWRDPIYRNLRELAMSYFHEYALRRKKTLRTYSRPFDLRRFDPSIWVTGNESCWDISTALDESRHYKLITFRQLRLLRLRDHFEERAEKLVEYPRPRSLK